MVTAAADETGLALTPYVDADWSLPARDLAWSCRRTAIHIATGQVWYASQVIGNNSDGYLSFALTPDRGEGPRQLLDLISVCATILRQTVEAAEPAGRAFHFWGLSDPQGFAAMGALETIVHTYDIAAGLGSAWRPPDHLCAPIVSRLFPHAPTGDPSVVLLWCTGREAMDGRPRQRAQSGDQPDRGRVGWRWDGSVREDEMP